MSGIMATFVGGVGGFPSLVLNVGYRQTTTGQGQNLNNFYGFQSGLEGSLTPSTGNFPPNTAQTISDLHYLDTANSYYLYLTSTATNSGWTSITINGLTLLRTSATFTTTGWTWTAPDSGAALTGSVGANVKISFA